LLCVLAIYFAVRLPWLLVVPLTDAPDEANHLWVINFIASHLRLPVQADLIAAGPAALYGALPTLGYFPSVLSELVLSGAARFGTLIVGAITVPIALAVAGEIFPRRSLCWYALPLLIALHPQLVFVQSYANTDATAITFTSAVLYIIVASFRKPLSLPMAAAAGMLFGLAALSKHTAFSVGPAVFGGILLACAAHKMSWQATLTRLCLSAAALSGIVVPYLVRNYFEFSGDILGTKTMYRMWAVILPRSGDGAIINPWPPVKSLSWWRYIWFDYWGLFGYMNKYLWRPIYFAYGLLCAGAIYGWVRAKLVPLASKRALWLTLLAFPLCNLVAMVAATLMNVSGPHGRYLFPSEIAICVLLLEGMRRAGSTGEKLIVTWLALNALVSVGAFIALYGNRVHF